jgi:hypothetical protein
VYLEGRFTLAAADTPVRIVLPGTDLLRRDALLAPEFTASQFDAVTHPLERCAIYDAGSRAFDVAAYLRDVRRYWHQVAELARNGFTLEEAIAERWTADPPARWSPPGRFELNSTAALSAVCEARLAALATR